MSALPLLLRRSKQIVLKTPMPIIVSLPAHGSCSCSRSAAAFVSD
jgi:hypothetical protein